MAYFWNKYDKNEKKPTILTYIKNKQQNKIYKKKVPWYFF